MVMVPTSVVAVMLIAGHITTSFLPGIGPSPTSSANTEAGQFHAAANPKGKRHHTAAVRFIDDSPIRWGNRVTLSEGAALTPRTTFCPANLMPTGVFYPPESLHSTQRRSC